MHTRRLTIQNRSEMLGNKARALFEQEISKGCQAFVCDAPVELEPPFQPLVTFDDFYRGEEGPAFAPARRIDRDQLVRLRVWMPKEHECDWTRNELFVKQLQALKHRIAFEVVGNQERLSIAFLCHADDQAVLRAAFLGIFPECELSPLAEHPFDRAAAETWVSAVMRSFYTPPPYSHLLTRPSELRLSPLEALVNNLSILPAPSLGAYQVVMQPVSAEHDGHRNVQLVIDLEYLAKLYGTTQHLQQRYAQQAPSGQLNNMANDVETKSHSDKPFFCVALRVALLNHAAQDAENALRAIHTFTHAFQHGGRPLATLSHTDFLPVGNENRIREMFRCGATYRPGSLLNSWEVCSLLHVPPLSSAICRGVDVEVVSAISGSVEHSTSGLHIGLTTRADQSRDVFIGDERRMAHIHVIGRPWMGKSCGLEYMGIHDIKRGHGIAVLDPHGDLAEGILSRIPEEFLDKVMYFDPGDPDYVPLFNPVAQKQNQKPDRQGDDLLRAFTQVSSGWGHRLETLMRQAFYGLIRTGEGTLLDVSLLLSTETSQREAIRKRVLNAVTNPKARHFWEHELKNYKNVDFAPVQHKLSRLLLYDTLGLMLSQKQDCFDFRSIMDKGMIFIANLATIGSEVRDILGGLLLSLIHLAALSRSDIPPNQRRPFHLYLDEAYRLVSDAMEDMLVETRKYRCSVTLAHQYLSQFVTKKRVDALGVVGTTMAFNVSADDAPRIAKFLGDPIEPEDLTALQQREAIVRIGSDVVRMRTPPLDEVSDFSVAERAKALSRERYYQPAEAVREEICRRYGAPSPRSVMPQDAVAAYDPEDFVYDVLLPRRES